MKVVVCVSIPYTHDTWEFFLFSRAERMESSEQSDHVSVGLQTAWLKIAHPIICTPYNLHKLEHVQACCSKALFLKMHTHSIITLDFAPVHSNMNQWLNNMFDINTSNPYHCFS